MRLTRQAGRRDLPKAFDVRRYAVTRTFSPVQWYAALSRRLVVWHRRDHWLSSEELSQQAVAYVEQELMSKPPQGVKPEERVRPLSSAERAKTLGVVPMSYVDVAHTYGQVQQRLKGLPEQERQWYERMLKGLGPEPRRDYVEAARNFAQRPVDALIGPKSCYLNIDLQLPDDFLISAFRDRLALLRQEHPSYSDGKMPNVEAWVTHQSVAAIDLMMWAAFSRVEIPDHVYGEALFPGESVNVSERFRRTSRKHRDDFLSVASWRSLEAWAYREMAQRKRNAPQSKAK